MNIVTSQLLASQFTLLRVSDVLRHHMHTRITRVAERVALRVIPDPCVCTYVGYGRRHFIHPCDTSFRALQACPQ